MSLSVDFCEFKGASDLNFVFGNLKITELTLSDIKFSRPVCPYLFKNSQITNMVLNNPRNAFGFAKIVGEHNKDILNVNINQMYLNHTFSNYQQRQWLDSENIINYDLFMNLNRININSASRLEYIQENTFNQFRSLKTLEMNRVNMNELLSKSRRWLRNLNYQVPEYEIDHISLNPSLSQTVFQLIMWGDDERKWTFNEEKDICLFRNFPHNKLVFPFILFTNENKFKCTCTVYWLYKYFDKYQAIYNMNQNVVPYHCFKRNNLLGSCKFEDLFQKYCPRYIPDPEESFTTLKPVYTTSYTTKFSASASTSYMLTSLSLATSTTSDDIDIEIKVATFYLAISLSVVCVIIIATLIILFYEVCNQNRKLDSLIQNAKNADVMRI